MGDQEYKLTLDIKCEGCGRDAAPHKWQPGYFTDKDTRPNEEGVFPPSEFSHKALVCQGCGYTTLVEKDRFYELVNQALGQQSSSDGQQRVQ